MWSQELTVSNDSWKLVQTNDDQITQLYPNYPKVFNHYYLDIKKSTLSISAPAGVKSFANFTLACTKAE